MNKILLISVKPEFAQKIFNGTKTIELRKSMPNVSKEDIVLIYGTVPNKCLMGFGRVDNTIKENPRAIWNTHAAHLGIDKKRYFEYYKDAAFAIGIMLKDIKLFPKPISLSEIKKTYPTFTPPQTFKYLDNSFFKKFQLK